MTNQFYIIYAALPGKTSLVHEGSTDLQSIMMKAERLATAHPGVRISIMRSLSSVIQPSVPSVVWTQAPQAWSA